MPAFTLNGNLPPGTYMVHEKEFRKSFGWNDHRRNQIARLEKVFDILRSAGVKEVILGGSFISSKDYPADIDGFWRPGEDFNLSKIASNLRRIIFQPELMRTVYGAHLFHAPEEIIAKGWMRFFETDHNNNDRGLVVVKLSRKKPA